MALTEQEILSSLDHCHTGYYSGFVSLGDPYSYLIDSRINLFRNNLDKWAIAVERLGDNPRAGGIERKIYYFGNCLINLDQYNNQTVNWSQNIVQESEDENHSRTLVANNPEKFRATDEELFRSVPQELTKYLVIDEWYHQDYVLLSTPVMSEEHLRHTYEFNKNLTGTELTYDQFAAEFRHQMMMQDEHNRNQWEHNRPSSYETWQLIAKAIVSGNAKDYAPTLQPNTHWTNWPESGSL